MIKFYEYQKCSTCKKAEKFMQSKKMTYRKIDIRENPPTKVEIKKMIKHYGNFKSCFNTSGQDYRAMNIKDSINEMTETEAINLLASNGNLIKRPFLVCEKALIVGFKEDEWKEVFKK